MCHHYHRASRVRYLSFYVDTLRSTRVPTNNFMSQVNYSNNPTYSMQYLSLGCNQDAIKIGT